MVYNMGTNDHPIGEIGVKVNDNAYHVVRFTRSGANSTIQVDDYNVQTNHPEGNNLSSNVRKMSRVTDTCSVQI
jgi:leucine-rich repeat transmembrane neuronal protein 1/2